MTYKKPILLIPTQFNRLQPKTITIYRAIVYRADIRSPDSGHFVTILVQFNMDLFEILRNLGVRKIRFGTSSNVIKELPVDN